MTPGRTFEALLAETLGDEALVRRALGLFEADLRELALVALGDWQAAGIASPEMFEPVAALSRPSWGSWNGLLAGLRRARRAALRSATAEQRQRIDAAHLLASVLEALDRSLAPEVAESLRPLATLTRATSRKLRVGDALAMPITLRNRLAHDAPADPAWWSQAAEALRPLVQFLAREDPWARLASEPRPQPWFLAAEDGESWVFNGLTHDLVPVYVRHGSSRHAEQTAHSVLLALAALLGKADVQERDFRKLLGRLAPEEMRGVLMGDFLVSRPVGRGGFATGTWLANSARGARWRSRSSTTGCPRTRACASSRKRRSCPVSTTRTSSR